MSETDDKSKGTFRDSNGNKSSKRIIGTIMIAAGGVYLVLVGVFSLNSPVADPETAIRAGSTLIYTGAALLGVGVVEGLGRGGAGR